MPVREAGIAASRHTPTAPTANAVALSYRFLLCFASGSALIFPSLINGARPFAQGLAQSVAEGMFGVFVLGIFYVPVWLGCLAILVRVRRPSMIAFLHGVPWPIYAILGLCIGEVSALAFVRYAHGA
jgi:hypothetical protein